MGDRDGGGGAAESYARKRQYDYNANSNLVLAAEKRGRSGAEPSGAPETLAGRLTKMGDRVSFAKPERPGAGGGGDDEAARRKKKRRGEGAAGDGIDYDLTVARGRAGGGGVGGGGGFLDAADAAAGSYVPRTRATADAFAALLSVVRAQFGDQPADVLHGAAEEVLAVLKDEARPESQKQGEVEALVGALGPERYAQVVALGRLVTDFVPADYLDGDGGAAQGGGVLGGDAALAAAAANNDDGDGGLDDEIGVAVEFEGESSEDEDGGGGLRGGEANEVVEVETDDDDDGGAGAAVRVGGGGGGGGEEAGAADDPTSGGVAAHDIDAHWLQRRVSAAFAGALDAAAAQQLADRAYALLADAALPDREAENALVALLDFDKFDLVRALLRDRAKIVWCVALARARSAEERAAVEAAAAASGASGAEVLAELAAASRLSAKDRQAAAERKIREEARAINGGEGGEGAAADDDDAGAAAAAAAAAASSSAARRHEIDLDSLAFTAGAHTMTNKRCDLPQGSYRTAFKGYEEVHVPAPAPPAFAAGEKLVPVDALPSWARPAFAGMKSLNRIQSRVCDAALYGSGNLLMCAPTGAGKTNVAMLTMLQVIGLHQKREKEKEKNEEEGGDGEEGKPSAFSASSVAVDTSAFKIVYVAPMKALVAEQVANFSKRLAPYGISVRELTGDANLTAAELAATQVVVTTPEKWDIVTRKAGDARSLTKQVKLVIIDEIHLLHDSRGPVLESIVARTLRTVEATQESVRLVGLSATLPNFEDVAAFLRVDPKEGLFHFGGEFRPCPLAQQYIGVTVRKPLQRFQLMNDICYDKIMAGAGKHQALVFVHSRKETAKTARALRDKAVAEGSLSRLMKESSASREILQAEAATCRDAALRDLLPCGFAIHHAGMARADRALVEDLFADGHVQVLCSTATLAWGVNLPAHTVIIKGTQVYSPEAGGWTELSPLDVGQMLGRAGRPQYDSQGEGIIITGHAQLQFYLSLINSQLPVESQLASSRLADALNAEVVLGTVSSLADAAAWLGYTYLFVRMLCAPALYGVDPASLEGDPRLLARRLDLAHSAALALDRAGLARYDRASGAVHATDAGRIAAHYYVSHQSIAAYASHLRPSMGDIELLRVFSLSSEFSRLVVRDEEKVELAKLLERVPIPVKERLDDPAAKVNALLQAYVSRLRLEGLALGADMQYVRDSAGRLTRCLFELCLRRGWARLAGAALQLAKCVGRRAWGCQSPLRQFRGVLPDVVARLERKDVPWERYHDLTPAELGELVRAPKAGRALHRLVHAFPRLELSASVQPITRSVLKVDLTLTPDFTWDAAALGMMVPGAGGGGGGASAAATDKNRTAGALGWWVLVEDADGEALLHHQYFVLRGSQADREHLLTFTVPVSDSPMPPQYFVRVVADQWLGAEATLPLSFRHLVLPDRFPPPTELLDLTPLPPSALRAPRYEEALFEGWTHFNPVQTQAFAALSGSDAAVLVCAPPGSGKTACAEVALVRMLLRRDAEAAEARAAAAKAKAAGKKAPKPFRHRAVCLVPHEGMASERFADWSRRLGPAGVAVAELTGDGPADLKALEASDVVVSTPERFDALSRRWKQRRAVRELSLVVADDLHLLGGPRGPAYEVVLSRLRYIAATQQQEEKEKGKKGATAASARPPTRFVGLAASLANARDVGEWLGAKAGSGIFAFAPAARPVPLEVHVQGFDVANPDARAAAMARPTYSAIVKHAASGKGGGGKGAAASPPLPSIVFVATRRHARLAALDLLTSAAADGEPSRFLGDAEAVRAALIEGGEGGEGGEASSKGGGVADAALRHALESGVGWRYEGQPASESAAVDALFSSGAISVVVATAPTAWGMRLRARCVVVAGTQAWDASADDEVGSGGGGGGGSSGGGDYPVVDILQMMGRATYSPSSSSSSSSSSSASPGRCTAVLMCHAPRKEYYKKFLLEPLPLESHLDRELHDHLAAEVVARVVTTKQDAVDWMTWTLLYRRLSANPNYYGLAGGSHRHLSDHLSDLVETTLADLEESKLIAVVEDGGDGEGAEAAAAAGGLLEPLNLGMIASYYYIGYATVELLGASLGPKTKLRGLFDIVSAASEFDALPCRPGEPAAVRRLLSHAQLPPPAPPAGSQVDWADPHVKAHALLQAHLSRKLSGLAPGLAADAAAVVVPTAARLLHAAVDVAASAGWLSPALAAMEASQSVAQALWPKDSQLLQLPHLRAGDAALRQAKAAGVESVFDLLDLDDAERARILGAVALTPAQLADVARAANRYPDISLAYRVEVEGVEGVAEGGSAGGDEDGDGEKKPPVLAAPEGANVTISVELEREGGVAPSTPPYTPHFPGGAPHPEGWWLVAGQPASNALLAVKRVAIGSAASARASLDFAAPRPGGGPVVLFFMCDAYVGCDQEYEVEVEVVEGGGGGVGGGGGGGAEEMDE